MKELKRTLILILTIFFISCNKEELRLWSQNDIWNCHDNSEWTDSKIINELIGSWKWIYSENNWTPDEGRNTENENTIIKFLIDSTLNVIVDGEIQDSTKWTITSNDGNFYRLELDSYVTSLLHGQILICDKIVLFNNSYIDGEDNYFKKIE